MDLALLVTQEGSGISDSVIIEKGTGDGTFSAGAVYPVGPVSNAIVATDFNGDGKLDLVVTNSGTYANKNLDGGITLLAGKGDGTFATSNIAFAGGTGRAPLGVAAADFNGDGKIDLAVTLSSISYYLGGLAIFAGRGDGTFQTPVIYSAGCFRRPGSGYQRRWGPGPDRFGQQREPGTGIAIHARKRRWDFST